MELALWNNFISLKCTVNTSKLHIIIKARQTHTKRAPERKQRVEKLDSYRAGQVHRTCRWDIWLIDWTCKREYTDLVKINMNLGKFHVLDWRMWPTCHYENPKWKKSCWIHVEIARLANSQITTTLLLFCILVNIMCMHVNCRESIIYFRGTPFFLEFFSIFFEIVCCLLFAHPFNVN